MRRELTVAVLLGLIAPVLSACATGGADTTSTVTVTATVTATPTAEDAGGGEPAATEPSGQQSTGDQTSGTSGAAAAAIGKEMDSGGLKMTITKAYRTDTIKYDDGSTDKARSGGEYIVFELDGYNDTAEGVDASCGLPAFATLIDVDGREFDQDLDIRRYDLPGDEECNDITPPGFPFETTWVFLAPKDTQFGDLSFYAVSSRNASGEDIVTVSVNDLLAEA